MSVANIGFMPPTPAYHEARLPAAKLSVAGQQRDRPQERINSTTADLQRLVFDRKLQFVVDHNSQEVIIKVIDRETDKVIKELPPEELQRLDNNLRETIGFLFDESV